MKEKLKKLLSSNGAMSLYSVFSLMAAFFLVCLAVLWTLSRAGVFEFPHAESTTESTASSPAPDPEEKTDYDYIAVPVNKAAVAKLLASYPFADNFYMEVYMTFSTQDGFMQDGVRLWKSGDRYKIVYNEGSDTRRSTIICDGKTVSYYSAADELTFTAEYSEAYAFDNIAYTPSFCLLASTEYEITDYYLRDNEYIVEYSIPSLSYTDRVHISADSGVVRSVRTYCGNIPVSRYDVVSYTLDYEFHGDEFTLR